MRPSRFFVPMILMASGAPLMGQEPAAGLDVGSRVRLTFPCELALPSFPESAGRTCRSDGRLALLTGDTIMIEAGDSTLVYDLNAVSRVEVSRGRKSHWLAGAGIGFVVGAATAYDRRVHRPGRSGRRRTGRRVGCRCRAVHSQRALAGRSGR
jgi:hypothetical protein